MESRQLGRTGRQVGVIGLGCGQLGADWGAVSEQDALATLHAAVDAGVTSIDPAKVRTSVLAHAGGDLGREANGPSLRFPDGVTLQLPEGCASPSAPDRDVFLGVRAEKMSVAPSDAVASDTMPAHIIVSEYLGAETVVAFKLGRRADQTEQDTVAKHDLQQARIPGELHLTPGADFTVRLDLTNVSFFDVDSGERLPVAVPEATR
jgi:hypothetical protein